MGKGEQGREMDGLMDTKVEGGASDGLVCGVVECWEVGVGESLVDGDALGGVEGEHAVQQVQRQRCGPREEPRERDLWSVT